MSRLLGHHFFKEPSSGFRCVLITGIDSKIEISILFSCEFVEFLILCRRPVSHLYANRLAESYHEQNRRISISKLESVVTEFYRVEELKTNFVSTI